MRPGEGRASRFGGTLKKPVHFFADGEPHVWMPGEFVEIPSSHFIGDDKAFPGIRYKITLLRNNVSVRLDVALWNDVLELLETGIGDANNWHPGDTAAKERPRTQGELRA